MDFKDRFGLDYLKRSPSGEPIVKPRSSSSSGEPIVKPRTSRSGGEDIVKPRSSNSDDVVLPRGLSDAVIAYSGKLLGALNAAPGHTMALFDIAKQLQTRVDALLPVTRILLDQGYIERTNEDPVGNDEFRLTSFGQKAAG